MFAGPEVVAPVPPHLAALSIARTFTPDSAAESAAVVPEEPMPTTSTSVSYSSLASTLATGV